jgi:hypothetical protein
MDRDALFLTSLIALAAAAVVVGVCGWLLWARDHRAAAAPASSDHPVPAEDS